MVIVDPSTVQIMPDCYTIIILLCLTVLQILSTLCREIPAEPLPFDDTGVSIDPEKLVDLPPPELLEENPQFRAEEDKDKLERLHEDHTSQTEVLEMCEGGEEKVEAEQPEAVDSNKEAVLQEAENTERIENSQEVQEVTEKLEDLNSLEQQDCDQITVQDTEASLQPEQSESEQLEMSENPEQMSTEGSHETEVQQSEDSDHLEPPQYLEVSSEVLLTDQATQPEAAEQLESPQLEQTVCVEAEDPGEAEEREQKAPSEDNKQSVNVTESQEEFDQEVKQAETSDQAEDVKGTKDEDVQTVVANGKQATIVINGGEVDREKARSLAEKLFKLDEIQPGDVVKHLDKE